MLIIAFFKTIHFQCGIGNYFINIHIQEPKVSLKNFDFVVVPEHDGLIGKNVITSKGAIHYLTNDELNKNENYLKDKTDVKKKIVCLIIGGPTKHYRYDTEIVDSIFNKIENTFIKNNYQLIVIPSMRTPQTIIDRAQKFFDHNQIIISTVDKKAYLSSLKLSDQIIVTCDSTSMISEAAITGKPIYVAQMPSVKNDQRFKNFFKLLKTPFTC